MQTVCDLAPDLRVYSLVGVASSHLIVRQGRGLLIDCHSAEMDRWLDRRNLPTPEIILHTHVQPEHCREANTFPGARILVHDQLAALAGDRAAWDRQARTTWDHPEDWPVTMGRETFGVGGSLTVFPPAVPLTVAATFTDGERLRWLDLTLEVVPLPGPSRSHVGFQLELDGRALALFSGDLLCHPAKLVNVHDLEITYGGTALGTLPALLRSLAERPVARWFPATGPALVDGPAQARELADAIDAYHAALRWTSGTFTPAAQPEYPKIGRYRQLHKGIYQIDNFGNCVVLIDDQGRGLMVDPGPCDYESADRRANFSRDLEVLEKECGLRTIDLVLVTHFHGDHYDMTDIVLARYPGCRVAAWDLVGRVIEAPWDYPYACLLPWYNIGVDHVAVDDLLDTDSLYYWHDIAIRTLHIPGHCYVHGAHLLTFNGLHLAITGDTIQSRGGADSLSYIISNHSVPDARSGVLKTYRQMVREAANAPIDLNIGGHGSHFTECAGQYAESLRRIEHALPYLRRLVPGGDLDAAFFRPSHPVWPRSE